MNSTRNVEYKSRQKIPYTHANSKAYKLMVYFSVDLQNYQKISGANPGSFKIGGGEGVLLQNRLGTLWTQEFYIKKNKIKTWQKMTNYT